MNYIESAYGKLYLSEDRMNEFIKIVSKHFDAMAMELKEHNFVPSHLSLEKTVVRESEYYLSYYEE